MTQKHILIIGASRGLGLGLVREYLGRGWRVTATVRDPAAASGLRDVAAGAKGMVAVEKVDIDDGAQVEALSQRLAGAAFDVVFVNAGVKGPVPQSAAITTPAEVAALFYTNAVAPIRIAEIFADRVVPESGVIAFMSSRTGSVAEPSSGAMTLYRASKAALNSMTRSFVANLGGRRITVLSLHPGWVRTDMGGDAAPLDVATSIAGVARVIDRRAGTHEHAFVNYDGTILPW